MLKSVTLATVLSLPLAAQAVTIDGFSDLVVFGDSLSDVNVEGLPPTLYPNQQVTNGNNWATLLGADRASGTNFAESSATAASNGDGVDDFLAQIQNFVDAGPALGDTPLAAVWFGGNDVGEAVLGGGFGARVQQGVEAVAAGLTQLAGLGFRDVLLFGVPDVGATPRLQAVADPAAAPGATALTNGFNAGLLQVAASFNGILNIAYVDPAAVTAPVLQDPAAFGFTNVEDACLTFSDTAPPEITFFCGADADGYLYYDSFHPTARAHALVAEAARGAAATIAPIPLPATASMTLLALAGLGMAARRRSKSPQ